MSQQPYSFFQSVERSFDKAAAFTNFEPGLLHQIKTVAALDRLHPCELGLAGLLVQRTFLKPGQGRITVLRALLHLRELAGRAGLRPHPLHVRAVFRRRQIAQAEEDVHRDDLGPVLDRLRLRHDVGAGSSWDRDIDRGPAPGIHRDFLSGCAGGRGR